MTGAAKAKGDRAEREVAELIHNLTGHPVRRALGAGRQDDIGDIHGLPDTVIQVANYTDLARASREKVPACEAQQLRAGATFGATFLRRPGKRYVVVLSPDQWATYYREATGE